MSCAGKFILFEKLLILFDFPRAFFRNRLHFVCDIQPNGRTDDAFYGLVLQLGRNFKCYHKSHGNPISSVVRTYYLKFIFLAKEKVNEFIIK